MEPRGQSRGPAFRRRKWPLFIHLARVRAAAPRPRWSARAADLSGRLRPPVSGRTLPWAATRCQAGGIIQGTPGSPWEEMALQGPVSRRKTPAGLYSQHQIHGPIKRLGAPVLPT
ncbi:hypothetical protein NDU88_000605 [Pleurodeles waltl]|uniref:Uncharacterized protein n=1 Tax=Pleurodeles waltl TaxID=8319 RepID=A0AAV7LVB3_PLEWA|nr:hypothetical protein NDU88_000605 [Pleurodeles waltl]